MGFEPSARARGADRPGGGVHPDRDRAGRGRAARRDPGGRRPLAAAAGDQGAAGEGPRQRPVESLPPARRAGQRAVRRGSVQPRLRPDRRAHRSLVHRAVRVQLQRAGHRQHGGPAPLRHSRAEEAVAGAVARRHDPVRVLHDRARRRVVRRHQHGRDRDRRRRRGRHQRPQVVEHRRRSPGLRAAHLHGPHRSRRPSVRAAHDGARPPRHPGREGRASPPRDAPVRRAARPRRGVVHRGPGAGVEHPGRTGQGVRDRAGPARARDGCTTACGWSAWPRRRSSSRSSAAPAGPRSASRWSTSAATGSGSPTPGSRSTKPGCSCCRRRTCWTPRGSRVR